MYLARDLELGIFRAVKELPITNRREARMLQLLEHPFLPKMLDYAEREEYCYIIMEYIRGRSLEQYLQDGYVFSLEEILHTGDVILQVLEYLHSRKPAVYYGDLKPANLMLTDQKRLYLVDFGSAVFSYSASYKETKGTRGYAAPEQMHGEISAESDFYALGKTLEILCGKRKLKYLLKCPLLGRFIFQCCRVKPEKRWQNVSEARKELLKLHPLQLRLKSILMPVVAVLAALAIVLRLGLGGKNLPELSKVVTPVTAQYYCMEYRSGSKEQKERVYNYVEQKLQNFQKIYQNKEEQIYLLELLAKNGELADRADRAEIYYRQLLTYEPEYTKGYLEYGLFLCRQARYQESRAVYRQWKKSVEETSKQVSGDIVIAWNAWQKEAGVILGKNRTSFTKQ